MTKAELLIDLKNFLGPGVDVDNTGLNNWLNDAYMYMVDEISKANPDYFAKSSRSSTVEDQQEYTLPTDFERALMVNVQLGGQWYRFTPLPNITGTGVHENTETPDFTLSNPKYYILGNEIGLAPIPDETTSNNIKLWYVYTPAELSDDADEPAIPAKYHHLLKYGAMANYLNRDQESTAAEVMRRRFESRVAQMVESMFENQSEDPKVIEIVDY